MGLSNVDWKRINSMTKELKEKGFLNNYIKNNIEFWDLTLKGKEYVQNAISTIKLTNSSLLNRYRNKIFEDDPF